MPPAARVSDMHTCPMVTGVVPHVGGPILPPCAITVITGGMPQARIGDMLVCVGPPDVIVKGSASVIVSGMPAARMSDTTAHGGVIVIGCPTVIIGDSAGGGGGGAAMAKAGAMGNPAAQAKAMIAAAQDGTPFCEKCAAPAGGAPPPPKAPAAAKAPAASDAAAVKAERAQTATDFFKNECGMTADQAADALKGVDLNQPVSVVDIPPPDKMSQFVRKATGFPGQWFNPDPKQTGDMLGLNDDPAIREVAEFITPKGKALKSIAAPIIDSWTDSAHPVSTKGGGVQMTVPKALVSQFKRI
jgi:uncharacterized Zn-binding protein involved in type VI secretion